MLFSLAKKSLLTLYLSVLRPNFATVTCNMSGECSNGGGNPDADKFSIVYVTVPDMDVAKNLSRGMVEGQMAACVNIIPQITSIYRWKGEIQEDNELLLMIKTQTSEVETITSYVRKNHPYEVCEVISVPIKDGNSAYFKWMETAVMKTQD